MCLEREEEWGVGDGECECECELRVAQQRSRRFFFTRRCAFFFFLLFSKDMVGGITRVPFRSERGGPTLNPCDWRIATIYGHSLHDFSVFVFEKS